MGMWIETMTGEENGRRANKSEVWGEEGGRRKVGRMDTKEH